MAMRDRLEELQSKRELLEKTNKKSDKHNNKMEGGKGLQNFLGDVGKIESDVARMKEDLSEIKKLQRDMLSTPFCEKESVIKYESMSEKIRHDATRIGGALKQLEKKYDVQNSANDSATSRVRTQQLNTLTTELNLATNDFFKTQAEYMDKMKSRLRRQLSARGDSGIDDTKIDELLNNDSYSIFTDNYVSDVQDAEQTLRDLEERKKDILKLEKSITDVNQLFKDMNLLVSNQGETLTTIEQAVDSTAVHVESGNKELNKAKEYRARARRKKCCIIIIILVCLAILGVILAIIFTS